MTGRRQGTVLRVRGAVAGRVLEHARREPGAVALRDERTTLLRGELMARSAHLAALLDDGSDGPVLLTRFDAISLGTGLVATNILGRPVVVAGWANDVEARRSVTAASGATVVLGAPEDRLPELAFVDLASVDAPDPTSTPDLRPLPSDGRGPFTIVTTSGFTGTPRLCHVTDGGVLLEGAAQGARPEGPAPGDRFALPVAGATAIVLALARALADGVPTTLVDVLRTPPSTLIGVLREHRISSLRLPASVLRRIVRTPAGTGPLTDLRAVSVYGEALLWSDVRGVRDRLSRTATVVTSYGTTEAGRVTLRAVLPEEPIGDGVVDVGRPIGGRQVWIDRGDGQPAAPGEEGEIVIEGELHRSGAGIEQLEDGRSRARPGDTGRLLPDGRLVLVGRTDRMLKIAANRVEPERVETVLLDVPGVLEAAAVAVEVAPGERRLVAHVTTDLTSDLTPSVILDGLSGRLPPAAMPARIVIHHDPLPKLATGKVDLVRLQSTPWPG